MKYLLLLVFFFLGTFCFAQKQKKVVQLDSIQKQAAKLDSIRKEKENLQIRINQIENWVIALIEKELEINKFQNTLTKYVMPCGGNADTTINYVNSFGRKVYVNVYKHLYTATIIIKVRNITYKNLITYGNEEVYKVSYESIIQNKKQLFFFMEENGKKKDVVEILKNNAEKEGVSPYVYLNYFQ